MNFLSHFYHEQPCIDPYYAVGVILPDILSNYSSRSGEVVKLFPAKLEDSAVVEIHSIIEGVKNHHVVDGFFHDSHYFKKNTAMITEVIKKYNISGLQKRMYAISHVLLEIMLDRKILKEDRESCDSFYTLLNQSEPEYITTLLKTHSTASQPGAVAKHFEVFRAARFIYDYLVDERLAEVISNLSKRLGNEPLTYSDKQLFKLAIHDIENAIISQKFPKFPTDS